MRSWMAAVSSMVEPFGMETETEICPWSISGISSMPAMAMLMTLRTQMASVMAMPAQRWVMRNFRLLR